MSSFLGVPSSLACDFSSSSSPFSTQEDLSQYFTKKYSFSDPQLDVTKVTMALFKADPQTQTKLIALLEQEASKGDSASAEKLYTFLTKPLGALDFRHLDQGKSQRLLQQGLAQEQTWAYWEKGQLEKTSQTPLTRWHCLAANRENASQSQKEYVQKHLKQTEGPPLEEIKLLTKEKLNKKKTRESIITKTQEFVDHWERIGYVQPLHNLLSLLHPLKTYTDLREQGYLYALKKGADLGGLKFQQDYVLALSDLSKAALFLHYSLKAANQGDQRSMYNAAILLEKGFEGQPADGGKAIALYLKAADKGCGEAGYNAAVLLEKGVGRQPADKVKAPALYLQAAEAGVVEAMNNAGLLWQKGFEGHPANKVKALELFLKAAEKDLPEAMLNAALLLEKGFEGHPADKAKALALYLKAAKKDLPVAMYNAGNLLFQGVEGHPADKVKALELFLRAAEKGFSPAMVTLALIYLQEPNEPNLTSALFWLEQADLLQHPGARKFLEAARQGAALNTSNNSKDQPEEDARDHELEKLVQETLEPLNAPVPKTIIRTSTERTSEEIPAASPTTLFSPRQDSPNPQENESDSSESDSPEMSPSLPTWDQKGTQKVNNVKLLRQNLREIGRIAKEQEMQRAHTILTLSPTEQAIADAIWAKETTSIDHNTLRTLFSARFFQGQVNLTPTKKGIVVSAFNRSTNQHATTGTHRKHNKSYDGAQPEFVKSLQTILALFRVKPSSSQ